MLMNHEGTFIELARKQSIDQYILAHGILSPDVAPKKGRRTVCIGM